MMRRRKFLQAFGLASVALALPKIVFARAVEAFKASSVDDVLKNLLGDMAVEMSDQIKFKIPDIAENGAVVPVTVSTDIAGVEKIYLLIDSNPTPLSAVFDIGPKIMADVSTRVKIGESSKARVVVRTADKAYMTEKEVKVTIGGCGG
ncbi:MAG: thiosulfate oxidation carrier protein SoxY [Pseudomonadales bacterium]